VLHYRVVEKLGEGGMGAVWKAIDTSLDRAVAIKVLPDAFASDAERLARFEREARLLASLNHPNIAAVYSVHEHEGTRFLAMELVEGEDLTHALARGPFALDEALRVAVQIAEALEAAHDNGVIHRDLKPANIQLTPAGRVKVLDFGLAKALGASTASGNPALSPTLTAAGTVAGMVLGTAGYMSPEQARGKEVDRRADVWAFGCVLYEMLTGRRAFDGETVSDTLASVLKVDPTWDALPAGTPPRVHRVLRRCLTRDVNRRLSHASGARVALQETLDGVPEERPGPSSAVPVRETRAWKRALPWALAGVFALLAAIALGRRPAESGSPPALMTLVAPLPDSYTVPSDQMDVLTLSPDGKMLALVLEKDGKKLLFTRRLDSPDMVPLAGTDDAATPFFSPDGAWIGFFADRKLKKIAVGGGRPVTLCGVDSDNRGGTWGTDDRISFTPHYAAGLAQVSAAGGEPTPLTTLDSARGERTHRWPQAVPGADLVLFTVGSLDSPESYDGSRIDAVRPSTGKRQTVLEGASMARYVPSGHLVFAREGFLFAVPFDIERLERRGNPVPVVENVMGMRSSGVVHMAFSRNGLLAYLAGAPRSRRSRLVWRYGDGRSEPAADPVAGYVNPRFSPDRKRVAVEIEGETTFDIWTWDVARRTSTRLTFEGDNTRPVWSPDGRKIAFATTRNGVAMTYVKAADGSGTETKVYGAETGSDWGPTIGPGAWSPDGRFLLLEFSNTRQQNIAVLDMEDGQVRVLLDSPAIEMTPVFSPDGRWFAYVSDESGRVEVYVRAFGEAGGKWQVSEAGGLAPRWSPEGRELYWRYQNSLYRARIDTGGDGFRVDRPQLVLNDLPPPDSAADFDVLDAERFLFALPAEHEHGPRGVSVTVNWLDDLRRRVPQ